MREYLTTSDIGRMCGDYTAQQVRNWWNNGELRAAELLNPGGKHLRFRKTARLDSWCAEKAKNSTRREKPIDYQRWWRRVRRCKDLVKKLGEELTLVWDGVDEAQEMVRQKPARMNLEEWMQQLELDALEAKAAGRDVAVPGKLVKLPVVPLPDRVRFTRCDLLFPTGRRTEVS